MWAISLPGGVGWGLVRIVAEIERWLCWERHAIKLCRHLEYICSSMIVGARHYCPPMLHRTTYLLYRHGPNGARPTPSSPKCQVCGTIWVKCPQVWRLVIPLYWLFIGPQAVEKYGWTIRGRPWFHLCNLFPPVYWWRYKTTNCQLRPKAVVFLKRIMTQDYQTHHRLFNESMGFLLFHVNTTIPICVQSTKLIPPISFSLHIYLYDDGFFAFHSLSRTHRILTQMASLVLLLAELLRPDKSKLINSNSTPASSSCSRFALAGSTGKWVVREPMSKLPKSENEEVVEVLSEMKVSVDLIWT